MHGCPFARHLVALPIKRNFEHHSILRDAVNSVLPSAMTTHDGGKVVIKDADKSPTEGALQVHFMSSIASLVTMCKPLSAGGDLCVLFNVVSRVRRCFWGSEAGSSPELSDDACLQ